ncbi:hypothetical protein, partial [Acetomicrobium sp. S15 = DSM 107314]|uniref:hypothetical protein n=1 Tax=Acetomicrobium sp. S15 = DSM 107314 TaxID=2529858 RepID=UPI0018E16FFB
GADYAGKVSVVDIGVPLESLSLPAAEVNAIERLDAARMLPPRPMNMLPVSTTMEELRSIFR